MATSMAAALAASLPTATTTTTPAQPVESQIPASMSKLVDLEAEIPLASIQLDGLVVSKILKHASESSLPVSIGLLLGTDLDGVLQISNSFPLPPHLDDEDKASKSVARYQTSMLRSLKEVQADDSIVGFYQATTKGAFFNQSFVETQVVHQEKLRHGGIVVLHDIGKAGRGNPSFRAFRLSKAFIAALKRGNFGTTSLITHQLTFSAILEEVPVTVRTSPLLSSFLKTLALPETGTSKQHRQLQDASESVLPATFSSLNLETSGIGKSLEQLIDSIDNYRTEEGNQAYLHRQTARERAKAEAIIAKRKEENAARVAQGVPPLPEEDISRLFKMPPEPSRLESTLLLGQIDEYAATLASVAGGSEVVKMYSAKN